MICDTLKQLRLENKLSQKQLADKIGTSQAAIYYWESGKREPRADVISKLANVFGVSVGDIIGELPFKDNSNKLDNMEMDIEVDTEYIKICMLKSFDKLNEIGKEEAQKRISELAEIKRYTRQLSQKDLRNHYK